MDQGTDKGQESYLSRGQGTAFMKLETQVLKDVQGTCNVPAAKIQGRMRRALSDGVVELCSAVSIEQTGLREAMTRGGAQTLSNCDQCLQLFLEGFGEEGAGHGQCSCQPAH